MLPHGCQFNLGLFVQDGFGEGGGNGHPDNPSFPRGLELDEETDIKSAAPAWLKDGALVPVAEGRRKTTDLGLVEGIDPSTPLLVDSVVRDAVPHAAIWGFLPGNLMPRCLSDVELQLRGTRFFAVTNGARGVRTPE